MNAMNCSFRIHFGTFCCRQTVEVSWGENSWGYLVLGVGTHQQLLEQERDLLRVLRAVDPQLVELRPRSMVSVEA